MDDGGGRDLARLLEAAAGGDQAAFRRLYGLTSAKLFGVAIRILRRPELAEEAVQEAYVQAWRMSASFDAAAGSPIAWLSTIARNKAIDLLRRSDEKLARLRPDVAAEEDELARIPDTAGDPETADHLRQLARCLEGVGADARSMVLLAYRDGWSRDELADRFARPEGTVKTILRRALIQLKACMDG